jgi:hypothetical protein
MLNLPENSYTKISYTNIPNLYISDSFASRDAISAPSNLSMVCDKGGFVFLQIKQERPKPEKEETSSNIIDITQSTPAELNTLKAEGTYETVAQADISKNELILKVSAKINILHQPVTALKHTLNNFEVTSLRFRPAISFQYTKDSILFPDGLSGHNEFLFELKIPLKPGQNNFAIPAFPELKPLSGHLYFISRANINLKRVAAHELVALDELNTNTIEELDIPILKSYRFLEPPTSILVEYDSLPAVTTLPAKLLNVHATSIITEDGKIASSLKLSLLNRGIQSLNIPTDPGTQLLGSYINNKPVKTFRANADSFTVHLPVSETNSPLKPLSIELKTLSTIKNQNDIQLTLPLPMQSLKTYWDIHYPSQLAISSLESNMKSQITNYSDSNPLDFEYTVLIQTLLKSGFSGMSNAVVIGLIVAACVLLLIFGLKAGSAITGPGVKKIWKWMAAVFGIFFLLFVLFLLMMPNYRMAREKSHDRTNMALQKEILGEREMLEMDRENSLRYDDAFDGNLAESGNAPAGSMIRRKMVKRRALNSFIDQAEIQIDDAPILEKSAYKKIRRSGVKPVEIRFPKLEKSISLTSSIPTIPQPFVKLSMKETKESGILHIYLPALGALFSAALFCFFWLKHSYFLALLPVPIFQMVLYLCDKNDYQATASILFIAILCIVLSLKLKKITGICAVLILTTSSFASSYPLQEKSSYPQPQPYKIYSPENLKSYDDYLLVPDRLWGQISSLKSDPQQTAYISKQSIQVHPSRDFKKLELQYLLEIEAIEKQKQIVLFQTKPHWQLKECRYGKNPAKIQLSASSSSNQWILNLDSHRTLTCKAEVTVATSSFSSESKASIPVANALVTMLTVQTNPGRYCYIDNAFQHENTWYLPASKENAQLTFTQRPREQHIQPLTSNLQFQNQYKNGRKFVKTEPSIHCKQTLKWNPPYYVFSMNYSVKSTDSFSIPVPKEAVISELSVKKNFSTLSQGLDYGLTKIADLLIFKFPAAEAYEIHLSLHLNHETALLELPFFPKEFKENSWSLTTLPSKGQRIQLQVNPQLKQFQSGFSTSSGSWKFSSIQLDKDNANASIKSEQKKHVQFSSVRVPILMHKFLFHENGEYLYQMNIHVINRGSQYLKLHLPENLTLQFAAINEENLTPAVEENSQLLLLPLKKYKNETQSFQIQLTLKGKSESLQHDVFITPLAYIDAEVDQMYFQMSSSCPLEFHKENVLAISDHPLQMRTLSYPSPKGEHAILFPFPSADFQYFAERKGQPDKDALKLRYKISKQPVKEKRTFDFALAFYGFFAMLITVLGARLTRESIKLYSIWLIICSAGSFLLPPSAATTFCVLIVVLLCILLPPKALSSAKEKTE